ncbi:MAG: TIGR01777 family oxidoreductase [Acidobacteriota bacterium]
MGKILISGASGLVGTALSRSLIAAGRDVRRLVRRRPVAPDAAFWDPAGGVLDAAAFDDIDAVVHLAGENIAAGRWTPAFKQRILSSRVEGTRLIAVAVGRCDPPPPLIVSSAIGYYGDRGDQVVGVGSTPGEGFLAEVCQQWEAAAEPARQAGGRVVHLRIGMVVSRSGGALKRMVTPFRLGLGGVVGDGRQRVSWIHLDDLVAVIEHILGREDLAGPFDAVAPHPVTNRELTQALGRVLGRPTVLPMPAALVRLVFGEMGQELLLASTRVEPAGLLSSGFDFRFADLESALRQELAP